MFLYLYVHVCSARLAAAAGTADHPGLKEEAKKDVITGRKPLQFHVTRHYGSFLLLIFSQLFGCLKNTITFSQIVLTRREMPNRKNTKDMVARRRKRRKRKMKSRKRNPHLAPHPTAVLLQVLSLKLMEEKELVMANIHLQHRLARKNQCPNSFQKANEEKRKQFPLSRRSPNC